MATRQSQKRLTKEYKAISATPPPYITAKPNDENILEWHYIISGPPNTPFEGGQYHGLLRFPHEYPFKPPSISVVTPNGRFACNTRLCLSMSDYHPDTWNPAWSVSTILTGLLSFMTGDETTTGSISTSESAKKRLAADSKSWNVTQNHRFKKVFPELVQSNMADILEAAEKARVEQQQETAIKPASHSEKPFNVRENAELLDPEDRARLLVEQDDDPGHSGVLQRFTLIGVVLAAFVAAYFSVIKH